MSKWLSSAAPFSWEIAMSPACKQPILSYSSALLLKSSGKPSRSYHHVMQSKSPKEWGAYQSNSWSPTHACGPGMSRLRGAVLQELGLKLPCKVFTWSMAMDAESAPALHFSLDVSFEHVHDLGLRLATWMLASPADQTHWDWVSDQGPGAAVSWVWRARRYRCRPQRIEQGRPNEGIPARFGSCCILCWMDPCITQRACASVL